MTYTQFDTDDSRWQAVSENNSDADGLFYYGVMTTGIYCRPSCSSKLPHRENVLYFTTCDDAEKSGYRACKRCKPQASSTTEVNELKIIHACRIIEKSRESLSLKDVAAKVNLSPFHFHRLFKKMVGVTPQQYRVRHKAHRFQEELKTSPSVTDAIYSAGYGSSGSAYDKKRDQLAMTPQQYRAGAAGIEIMYGIAECSLGWLIVAATDRGICAIEFSDERHTLPDQLQARFPKAELKVADSEFTSLIEKVVTFIESPVRTFQLPLDIQGTAFQQRVWEILRNIKPGETVSYSAVAQSMGNPKAVRAVANACGANKLAVVIPCHRVISKSGEAGGYRWGKERKKRLLELEQETKRRQ